MLSEGVAGFVAPDRRPVGSHFVEGSQGSLADEEDQEEGEVGEVTCECRDDHMLPELWMLLEEKQGLEWVEFSSFLADESSHMLWIVGRFVSGLATERPNSFQVSCERARL